MCYSHLHCLPAMSLTQSAPLKITVARQKYLLGLRNPQQGRALPFMSPSLVQVSKQHVFLLIYSDGGKDTGPFSTVITWRICTDLVLLQLSA